MCFFSSLNHHFNYFDRHFSFRRKWTIFSQPATPCIQTTHSMTSSCSRATPSSTQTRSRNKLATISRVQQRSETKGQPTLPSAATPIPSFNLSTAFDHLNPPGARNFHEFSRSATEAPSHQTSRLCDSLELTAGSGTGIPSSPKHIVLGACLAQGGHPAKHTPRVAVEPIKRVRRVRANDRERKRMKSLNRALESLKKCIPVPQSKRRVTKLEVLRIACSYIRSLSETLNDESDSNAFFRNLGASDAVVNGFSVAQRLEILSGTGAPRI